MKQMKPKRGIGGSDIAAILGISPWRSPRHVYERIFGLEAERDSAPMWAGRHLEQAIIAMFQERRPAWRAEDAATVRRETTGFLAEGTPDALLFSRVGKRGILDVKNTRSGRDWGPDGGGRDDVPPHYAAQLDWYMWMTGADYGFLAVLISGFEFRSYKLPRSKRAERRILAAVTDFWQRYVVTETPPPVTDKDTVDIAPAPDVGILTADGKTIELAWAYNELRCKAKALEAEYKTIENRLKEIIGPAEGVTGDGFTITWRPDKNGRRRWAAHFDKET